MKISSRMDLDQLASLIGQEVTGEKAKRLRRRLVLAFNGLDTDNIAATDWQTCIRDSDPSLEKVDALLAAASGYWFHYNRKTEQIVAGFKTPERTGNRSIDGSWVGFEVATSDAAVAEQLVRKYVALPQAKFAGRLVTIVNGVARNGDNAFPLEWS